MAVTAVVYGLACESLGEALFDFTADEIKVMLTTSSYVPNPDTHKYKSSITNEITGTGYTAGGQALANLAWTYNSTANRMELTADPSVWDPATFTCRYAVIYKNNGGVAATSPLLSYLDFGTDQAPVAVPFTINWDSTGVARLTALTSP